MKNFAQLCKYHAAALRHGYENLHKSFFTIPLVLDSRVEKG